MKRTSAGILLLLCWLALAGRAVADVPVPAPVREVNIEEHLGGTIATHVELTDESGRHLRLSELFQGDKPVLLVLAYFRCPMLCGLLLRGVVDGLSDLDWKPGEHYRAVTISFDPKDTPDAALHKQENVLDALHAADARESWPFLVGREAQIRALTDSVGFRYAYDAATDQFAHPAALVVLTPQGKISRYLYGIQFSANDLRLALLEASQGRVGTVIDRILMTCYRYDPATRRYGPYVFGFMRIGAVLILAVLAIVVVLSYRLGRRRRTSP